MTSKQESNKRLEMGSDARKRMLAALVCGLVAACMWWLPAVGDLLRHLEVKTRDILTTRDARVKPREDLVFLGIDAASLRVSGVSEEEIAGSATLQRMQGQFPWDRRVYAEAIDRLGNAGAKVIILDIVLAQDGVGEEDQGLADAIARHRDKVVLASAFTPVPSGNGNDVTVVVDPAEVFLGPLENETATGFSNFWPLDGDGVVRVAHFRKTLNEANDMKRHPDEHVYDSIASAAARKLGVSAPKEPKRFRMGFADQELAIHSYEPKSLVSIFTEKEWENNYQNGAFFKDKVVIIGPATPMFHDQHQTAGGKIYGAQIHLHVLAAILDDTWYEEIKLTTARKWGLSLLGLVLVLVVVRFFAKPGWLSLSGLVFCVAIILVMVLAMTLGDWLFGGWSVGFTFLLGILGAIITQSINERARRQELYKHLQRSMSPDVADAIVRAPEGYYRAALGNRRQVTVLFADVRGFTLRSEQQDAGQLVSQLNEYLEQMVEVIFDHGGTVDKFIGDAIMATWGMIEETQGDWDSRNAVSAALSMLDKLNRLNTKWQASGLDPFEIGIGIHRGEAIVGEVGSDQRTDFTVIGDAVNLASRVEGLTKAINVDLLVTSSVAEQLEEVWQSAGTVRVKGREQGVELFVPALGDQSAQRLLNQFLESFVNGGMVQAQSHLTKFEEAGELKGLMGFYQNQIDRIKQEGGFPEGWDGVMRMSTK